MGNSIGKTTINSDAEVFSRISSDSASASSGNFLNPDSIVKDYWTDGELEVIDMENGTYLIEQDGTAMGWTDAEGANSILSVNANDTIDEQGESNLNSPNDSGSETIEQVDSDNNSQKSFVEAAEEWKNEHVDEQLNSGDEKIPLDEDNTSEVSQTDDVSEKTSVLNDSIDAVKTNIDNQFEISTELENKENITSSETQIVDFSPQNMQEVANKLSIDQLPTDFNGSNVETIEQLKKDTGARFGLDIAHYQYPIDYQAVANSGIDYVIIQWGGRSSSGGRYIDGGLSEDEIRQNVMSAIDAGLDVSLYTWGQPINEAEATEEAQWTVDFIKTLPDEYQERLTMPIAYDYEAFGGRSEGISLEQHTNNINAFNQVLSDNGFDTMTYSMRSAFNNRFDGNAILNSSNYNWVAEYGTDNKYDGDYSMWQYTSNGNVAGIPNRVDVNVYYENPDKINHMENNDIKDAEQKNADVATETEVSTIEPVTQNVIEKVNDNSDNQNVSEQQNSTYETNQKIDSIKENVESISAVETSSELVKDVVDSAQSTVKNVQKFLDYQKLLNDDYQLKDYVEFGNQKILAAEKEGEGTKLFTYNDDNSLVGSIIIDGDISTVDYNPETNNVSVVNSAGETVEYNADRIQASIALAQKYEETNTGRYYNTDGEKVVEVARSTIGTPYVWGGCSPSGYDCSGLVAYAITGKHARLGTTYTFMGWPRVSDPKPGDICVNPSHTGIYSGNGQMINAADYGIGVIESPVQSDMIFVRPPEGI